MTKDRLIYLPFGGAGEIGMNMYVYGYGPKGKERFIVVDTGVLFPDMGTAPGVDLVLADYAWLMERNSQVEAIFLTHGHLDHLGAVSLISQDLNVPVYARDFSKQVALDRVREYGGNDRLFHTAGSYPDTIKTGPFKVSFVPISHSIPESSCLIIDTPVGRVVHTGDFKLDHDPVIGDPFDEVIWEEIASEKILALVCDSTNALNMGAGRSESKLESNLMNLIEECEGMVIATTFASHIARIYQISLVAEQCGRFVVLLGRAMNRMVNLALEVGILVDLPNLISINEARNLPRNSLVVLATGSQGEGRAATAQLSRGGSFKGIKVKRGDTLIYSSKTIPGNEVPVSKIQNSFAELGVDIVDDSSGLYHVSGHPNISDLEKLHKLVNPNLVIPMHGEYRHLKKHAELAINAGFNALVAPNGTKVDILREEILREEKEKIGKQCIDGNQLVDIEDNSIRERLKMAQDGLVSVYLQQNSNGFPKEGIIIQISGLHAVTFEEFENALKSTILSKLNQLSHRKLSRENETKTMISKTAKKFCIDYLRKSPVIQVNIQKSMT